MAFTERHEYKIEIIPPYNILQCRRADIVEKDGVEVGRTYQRHSKLPGDDMSEECAEMQAVAAALWTQDVIDTFKARKKDRVAQEQPQETPLSDLAE
jgi:hypothetical protein